ncbi:MAG: ABC transporter [Phototrophicales bacterium]|nr:MAG: ABC transporter [Phototrophicales bacterium]
MSELCLKEVSYQYQEAGRTVPALENISMTVKNGEFVSIIGASGAGKSTLLQLISGLLRPTHGQITVNGQAIQPQKRQVAYMPQNDALLPWRNVLQNVVLGPEIQGKGRRQALAQAKRLLPLFGLEGFGDAFPAQLSGGMRQRAALLRTFLIGSDILLLDEPFGALDAITRRELQRWLLDVWEQFKYTVLFVTHDVEEALFLSDRVVVLSPRPGTIVLDMPIPFARPRQQHFDAYSSAVIEHETALLRALKGKPDATTSIDRLQTKLSR